MHKAEIIAANKEQIQAFAKISRIDHNSIHLSESLFKKWAEKDKVRFLVSVDEKPDEIDESAQGSLLKQFQVNLEELLGFKVIIEARYTREAWMEETITDDLKEEERKVIDSSIQLEDLTVEPLVDQFKKSRENIEKKPLLSREKKRRISDASISLTPPSVDDDTDLESPVKRQRTLELGSMQDEDFSEEKFRVPSPVSLCQPSSSALFASSGRKEIVLVNALSPELEELAQTVIEAMRKNPQCADAMLAFIREGFANTKQLTHS